MAGKKPKKELLDPRQILFLELYLKPGTETFSNAYKSAIAAGYSETYADNIRVKTLDWVSENVGEVTKDELVKKSKRVLNKTLDGDDIKLAQDTAKFVAKSDIEFSEKTDITSNGKELQPLLVKFIDGNNRNTD